VILQYAIFIIRKNSEDKLRVYKLWNIIQRAFVKQIHSVTYGYFDEFDIPLYSSFKYFLDMSTNTQEHE